MEGRMAGFISATHHQLSSEGEMDVRKGPWTAEEDSLLTSYVAIHGEGHWNAVARYAGLKRTGKSCRLRWLNYLRPDVRRGNISLQEQLLILELHSRWGNRWSKIAQYLPGRTDNEIKNYWRTRVQKQAKQLKCDVNSQLFRDAMRNVWMPRLLEQIQAQSDSSSGQPASTYTDNHSTSSNHAEISTTTSQLYYTNKSGSDSNLVPDISRSSSESFGAQVSPGSELTDCYYMHNDYANNIESGSGVDPNNMIGSWDLLDNMQQDDLFSSGGDGESLESIWSDENIFFFQQQLL